MERERYEGIVNSRVVGESYGEMWARKMGDVVGLMYRCWGMKNLYVVGRWIVEVGRGDVREGEVLGVERGFEGMERVVGLVQLSPPCRGVEGGGVIREKL